MSAHPGSKLATILPFLRLALTPILLLIAFFWPTAFFSLWGPVINENFDLVRYGVAIGSTLVVRAMLFFGTLLTFILLRTLLNRYVSRTISGLLVSTAFLVYSFIIFGQNSHSKYWAAAIAVVVGLNTLPAETWFGIVKRPPMAVLLWITPVLSEMLIPEALLAWYARRLNGKRIPSLVEGIGVLQGAALLALMLSQSTALSVDRKLFQDPDVQRFATGEMKAKSSGDFTWIALDLPMRRLYACGNGSNWLRAFDLDHLDLEPKKSRVTNGYAQFCSFNPLHDELYFYDKGGRKLVWLDSKTLEPKHVVDYQLPPGEVFVQYSNALDWVVFASEDVRSQGNPVHAFDRVTTEHRQSIPVAPGYLIAHNTEPWIYIDFWRNRNELLRFDLRDPRVPGSVPTDRRTDRIALDPKRNEILVVSPLRSRVLRFDAVTLAPKGVIPTLFGSRTIGLDYKRDLLISGSMITNELEVWSLKNSCSLARFRLGPWLREIAVDSDAGVAYVSSLGSIYKVQYLKRVEQSAGCKM